MGAVEAKLVTAFTVSVWLALAPSTTLLFAVTKPLAVMGAVEANVVTALTARVLLPPLVPNTELPRALKTLPAVTVTAALAVMGAVEAKAICFASLIFVLDVTWGQAATKLMSIDVMMAKTGRSMCLQAYREHRAHLSSRPFYRAIIAAEQNAAQHKPICHCTSTILPLKPEHCSTSSCAAVAEHLEASAECGGGMDEQCAAGVAAEHCVPKRAEHTAIVDSNRSIGSDGRSRGKGGDSIHCESLTAACTQDHIGIGSDGRCGGKGCDSIDSQTVGAIGAQNTVAVGVESMTCTHCDSSICCDGSVGSDGRIRGKGGGRIHSQGIATTTGPQYCVAQRTEQTTSSNSDGSISSDGRCRGKGGKAGAVNGEAVHRLATAATCAASCGGAQDQAAPSVASSVLKTRGWTM
ncbi:MAG: hypothetical protein FRX49_04951 [Trebouxia sp. A1-2]|nr:MAG: hypothetical protein FRX49_04951 [Trebouxia sp. A1-2]